MPEPRRVRPDGTCRAKVVIRLGTVNGVPTADARVYPLTHIVDEFGVRQWSAGELMLGIQRTIYPEEYPPLRPKAFNPLAKQLGKPDRRQQFGRLWFTMLDMVKGELEKQTYCWVCERGKVWFRRTKVADREAVYQASWKTPNQLMPHVCQACWKKSHPIRAVFNPAPEADREDPDYPANKDNVFYDCVNELGRVPRESMLENIDFMYALDVQATNQFLGDERLDDEIHLAGPAGQAAVEILMNEVAQKGIFERELSAD